MAAIPPTTQLARPVICGIPPVLAFEVAVPAEAMLVESMPVVELASEVELLLVPAVPVNVVSEAAPVEEGVGAALVMIGDATLVAEAAAEPASLVSDGP